MTVAFGSDTDVPPRFGEAVKNCYHIYLALIFVAETSDGGWGVDDTLDLGLAGQRSMSGNIHKSCVCMSALQMLGLKASLAAAGISQGVTVEPSQGTRRGTTYMVLEIEYRGKCPPLDCKCTKNIDLGGMSKHDGHWTSSNGEMRQFPGSDHADVMRDVINTERSIPCDCS